MSARALDVLIVVCYALIWGGGCVHGWLARTWWGAREAERFVRRAHEIEAHAQHERWWRNLRARQEQLETWHVEAETPEEALAAFHRRAPGLRAGGTL